jgi:hypothetical protein
MTVSEANHRAHDHARRSHPPFQRGREQREERQTRAQRWFEGAITTWQHEDRITSLEADKLRADLHEPQFLAVLPHFGVHLAVGAVLRFPIGSIVRASYVLLNLLLATLRLLGRSIDRHAWRQALGIHSPLVMLVAGMPGIGTFAYLASKPMRSNPLLLRVGLDAALIRLPKRVYERSGARWVIARPQDIATRSLLAEQPPLRLTVWAQSIVLVLGLIVGGLFAADLVTQVAAELHIVDPDAMVVRQVLRMLNLGAETSFGTWYQVMALVLLAATLAAIGVAKRQAGDPFTRHWIILALLALGFSLDEQVKLHDAGGGAEVLRENLSLTGPIFYGWVAFGLLSVVVVGLYFRRFLAALPQTTRRLFALAAALFVGGEIGMESVAGWYADISGSETDLLYQTITSFEEFFGMAGILVAIAATLHYAQVHFGEVRVALHDDCLVENETPAAVRPRPGPIQNANQRGGLR